MTDKRPGFLHVAYGDSGLTTMDYEQKLVREKDVKFDGDDGSIELTDVRLVWYKKPSRWGSLKKVGAIAGAVAGAAALHALGSGVGGRGGRAIRRFGTGLGIAGVGMAISSWTRDSYVNKDKDGNTESIALPVVAIREVSQKGKEMIVFLKAGGEMRFEFKQKKVIPSIIANVTSAKEKGKCPYCGTSTGGALACPNCGAPIEPGAAGSPGQAPASGGGAGFCKNCGQPLESGDKFCGKCGQKT